MPHYRINFRQSRAAGGLERIFVLPIAAALTLNSPYCRRRQAFCRNGD